MAEAVYVLSTLTSMACALLLLRSYRRSRARLLLWSSTCFAGLAANNVLLLIDFYAIPSVSLEMARAATALASLTLLLFGLLWDTH
jgi:hypothetical protein